jgi:hypothetical protein
VLWSPLNYTYGGFKVDDGILMNKQVWDIFYINKIIIKVKKEERKTKQRSSFII